MLTKKIEKRLSAEEALADVWFQKHGEDDKPLDLDHINNLKNFGIKSKMQQAIYFFLINQTITQEEKEQLTATFKKLDTNNDGVVSKKELI